MRAKTQLFVENSMRIRIELDMTVSEMKELLNVLDANVAWPCTQLKSILAQSLRKASDAYESEHEVAG